jgi:ribonuclease P protein component
MAAIEILKRRADFLRLKNGRRHSTAAFVLQAMPRDETGRADACARFGFTVSDHAIAARTPDGRKHGGAVKRNRARRRLKEAVRLLAAGHAKPGFDYVVVGRFNALTRDFADLLADMKLAFHKVHADDGRGNAPERRRGRGRPTV